MPTLKHTHSYVFYKIIGGEKHYKCNDPHCTSIAPVSLIRNKASLCPICNLRELILDTTALRRKVPRCIECSETKEARDFKRKRDLMDNLLTPGRIPEEVEKSDY